MSGSPAAGSGSTVRSVPAAPPPPAGQPPWRHVLPVGAAALALGCLFLVAQFLRLGFDVTAPFHVGSIFGLDEELAGRGVQVQVQRGPGYDGQWFLGLAYDPLLVDDVTDGFDLPRYRAGRPLQAMVGWALAAGRTPAMPAGLLAVGPLTLALGAMALARLVVAYGRTRWWGLGFALLPGVVVGVAFGTAEPLGLALSVLGLGVVLERASAGPSRRRTTELLAGLAFAAAALTKESYLLFAVAGAFYLATLPGRGGWSRLRPGMVLLGLPLAALAGWWAYVLGAVAPGVDDDAPLGAIGPPLLGWGRTLLLLARADYAVDGPVDPAGYLLVLGSLAAGVAGIVVGVRSTSLPARVGLVLGGYAMCLSGSLLGHFLSSMRALAPTVLGAALAVGLGRRRRPPVDTRDEQPPPLRQGSARGAPRDR
jgi:hypothetical protein